ncbi:putative transmembrane protein [Toxoplasma gondii FOU]|uniref:Putative transmembrane protein n=2 Tax=Toxoplasma gondii TaxID=5811 RepID=A0A086LFK0_TOXGO|nr:putative transmembrane protein [Toxoplasma gondii FOU]PUA92753.1 putative transmembrane protein [Toxoplasma gondii TgCATBr9]
MHHRRRWDSRQLGGRFQHHRRLKPTQRLRRLFAFRLPQLLKKTANRTLASVASSHFAGSLPSCSRHLSRFFLPSLSMRPQSLSPLSVLLLSFLSFLALLSSLRSSVPRPLSLFFASRFSPSPDVFFSSLVVLVSLLVCFSSSTDVGGARMKGSVTTRREARERRDRETIPDGFSTTTSRS